jgi:hypothetical protein
MGRLSGTGMAKAVAVAGVEIYTTSLGKGFLQLTGFHFLS